MRSCLSITFALLLVTSSVEFADAHNSKDIKRIEALQEQLKHTSMLIEEVEIKQEGIGEIDTPAKLAYSQMLLNQEITLTKLRAKEHFALAAANRAAAKDQ